MEFEGVHSHTVYTCTTITHTCTTTDNNCRVHGHLT